MRRAFFHFSVMVAIVTGGMARALVVNAGGEEAQPINPAVLQIDATSINQKREPQFEKLAWKLASELNNPSFGVRSFARQSLIKLGRASIDALEFASRSEDCETRITALSLLTQLRGRGFMGVGMYQINAPITGELLPDELQPSQVSVNLVQAGSPAQEAGLLAGDMIIELNGHPVTTNNDLYREVILTGPARTLAVTVLRGDQKFCMTMLLTFNSGPVPEHAIQGTGFYPPKPPLDLESELPESERSKTAANMMAQNQIRINGGGVVVLNGQVIMNGPNGQLVVQGNNAPVPNPAAQPKNNTPVDAAFVQACEAKLSELKGATK